MDPNRVFVLVGCGVFLLIVAGLHVVRGDVPPLTSGISRYAGAPTLLLATVAFLALAGGAAGLARMAPQAGAQRGLLMASAGLVVVAMTPIGHPDTRVGVTALHTVGGLAFYLGALAAMFTAGSYSADRRFGWFTLALLLLFAASGSGTPPINGLHGLFQRMVFAAIVTWMIRAAL
jgi:hypothetical protein